MAKQFDWNEFLRVSIGITLIGMGISVIGTSSGELWRMVIGFVFIGVGIAILSSK